MIRFARVMAVAGIIVITLFGMARMWALWSLAPTGGREPITGLGDSVTVLWDSLAVPHVIAQSDSDFFTAMGYLHARDRMWQMDLLRHIAEGRLSELFGRRTAGEDMTWRELELRRLAATRLAAASSETRSVLGAYARGVNAWLGQDRRALEFRLLRHQPEPWTPLHGIEIALLQAWDLRTTGDEVELADLAARLGHERAAELLPVPRPGSPVIVDEENGGRAADRRVGKPDNHPRRPIRRGAGSTRSADRPAFASNSWAIAGTRTASGKPILANDPHLTLRAPSIWYLVGAHAPGYEVVGATIPGLPVVVLGHTAAVAWGFTNAMVDDVDYVVEELSPDRQRYRTARGWAAVELVPETIFVRDDDPFLYDRRRTAHGPLVSTGWLGTSNRSTALRWTAQYAGSDELLALLGMARASDVSSFAAAIEEFRSPEQNIVYADTAGVIAYWLAGRVPVRRQPDRWLPSEGWSDPAPWTGFLPTSALPHLRNPSSGWIVTANNRVVDNAGSPFLSRHYDPGYRAQRIIELLRADTVSTTASSSRHQMDILDIFARTNRSAAARAAQAAGRSDLADRLRAWDGTMEAEAVEPTLFWTWYRELQRLTYDDESPGYAPAEPLHRWLRDDGENKWFDDVRTLERESLDTVSGRAMRNTLADRRVAPWGDVHETVMEHPLAAVPIIGTLLGFRIGPLPASGSNYTVGNASSSVRRPPFNTSYGPSLRHVVDMGNPDGGGGFIIATGQSGHPLSRHYRDQTEHWQRGRLWILPVDETRVRARDTMILLPTAVFGSRPGSLKKTPQGFPWGASLARHRAP